MNPAQVESFLDLYYHASGDRAHSRIGDFVTAYTAFRCAYCMMAANALQGSEEQGRLEAAAEEYAASLELARRTKLCLKTSLQPHS
jgi:hypothetical protein